MTDDTTPNERTCEWCDSPMPSGARAVCPNCGRLASRLSVMEEPELPPPGEGVLYGDDAVLAAAAGASTPLPTPAPPADATAPPPPPPPPPAAAPPKPPAAASVPKAPAKPPAKPAPAPAAASGGGSGDRDAPLPPGIAWPTPEPLPPEDGGRAWWKIAVPAAVVVVLLVIGAVFVFGGSDSGSDSGQVATPTTSKDSVDISDLEDPAETEPRKTTTTEATTTTTTEAEESTPGSDRTAVDSGLGVEWTMAAEPDNAGVSSTSGGPQRWTAAADDATTETVEITDLDGVTFDLAAAINAFAATYGGEVSTIQDSHLAQVAGSTASFTGTADGQPVVGYVVAAQSGDRGIVVATVRKGGALDDLYLDWLPLPGSFTITE